MEKRGFEWIEEGPSVSIPESQMGKIIKDKASVAWDYTHRWARSTDVYPILL